MVKNVLAETCSWHVMYNWQYSCVMTVMSMHNYFLMKGLGLIFWNLSAWSLVDRNWIRIYCNNRRFIIQFLISNRLLAPMLCVDRAVPPPLLCSFMTCYRMTWNFKSMGSSFMGINNFHFTISFPYKGSQWFLAEFWISRHIP